VAAADLEGAGASDGGLPKAPGNPTVARRDSAQELTRVTPGADRRLALVIVCTYHPLSGG
jgi:hypothetical protein